MDPTAPGELPISPLQHIQLERRHDVVVPLTFQQMRHPSLVRELAELALRLQEAGEELEVTPLKPVGVHEEPSEEPPDPAWAETPDLVAEDLATFALDLAHEQSVVDVIRAVADAVAALVPGACEVVVSLLRHGDVELCAATASAAESCEAWQLALGDGPAATASDEPGTVVVVDDLATDPRWPHLQVTEARDSLPSLVSVAASLRTSARTLVISWYGTRRGAFSTPDCARVALLTTAHASLALDRALREDELQAEIRRIDDQLG